jgi:hypothetical protein
MQKAAIKLQQIQTELVAPKNLENKFGNYRYRSAEGILEALKPHLEKHQAVLTLCDEMVEVGGRVYVKADAAFYADGEMICVSAYAREPESKKGMDEAQVTGATSSYARKYALNGLFCIDDTKDADALNDHGKSAPAADDLLDKIIESFNMQTTMEGLDAKLTKAKTTPYKDNQQMLDAYNHKAQELNTK